MVALNLKRFRQSFQHRKRSGEFIVEAHDLRLLIGGELGEECWRPRCEVSFQNGESKS